MNAERPVDPWQVREVGLDLDRLAETESIFALANGHLGVRGNLDEGEPCGLPGSYLNGFHESYPLSYAERGYGYPECGQRVLDVTNAKLVRLLVDDEPFDVRYGTLRRHERTLDLRAGTLRRVAEWRSPAGQVVRVTSTRLVSFVQRAVLAIRYEVEPVEQDLRVVVQSELAANEPSGERPDGPLLQAALDHPLQLELGRVRGHRGVLVHRTRNSGLRVAVAADHVLDGDPRQDDVDYQADTVAEGDWARTTVSARLAPGQRLTVTKLVTYGWSAHRSVGALRDQVEAALSSALDTGWDGLLGEQRDYLDRFWACADVAVEGDPEAQQAVRYGLYSVLQAGARGEQRAIPGKGLTGTGYAGHAFWDTEMFVLPVLTATLPEAAADALRWRHRTLPRALARAGTLRLRGAAFPWRTIAGEECGAYWPAGTAAFHVNADVAVAAARYVTWTGDEEFDRLCALPLLVETARLWSSLGYLGADRRWHVDGVTGPDEYSALVDDNTYTNLMAAQNLRAAAAAARRWPEDAAGRGVEADEIACWEHAAEVVAVPYDQAGTPEQARGYHQREPWDFAASAAEDGYPLQAYHPYFDLYRHQVAKQADLVLALHWCGDRFSLEEKAAAFAHYEELTVRDSSLSACSQAVVAAEVGQLELAHDYLREAALMDLRNLQGDGAHGVHVASAAGSWLALVCGFGGLRDHDGVLGFAPRLPPALTRLSFGLRWRGVPVRVTVTPGRARYEVTGDADTVVELRHHGLPVTVRATDPVELDIPALTPLTDRPGQPAGREPRGVR